MPSPEATILPGKSLSSDPGILHVSGMNTQKSAKTYSLGELASLLGAVLKGDPAIQIGGVGTLEHACPGQLSFMMNARYSKLLSQCNASALIVPPALEDLDRPLLVTSEPYVALARAAQLFANRPHLARGVHSSSHLGEGVLLGEEVGVGPLAQIGANCRIGRGTDIHGGVFLGSDVTVGEECVLYPNVTVLDRCVIGNRVIIHSGTVIGSDGFGYAQDAQGRSIKIPQAGIVQIDDDVEIGANCTVDRAAFARTWIQSGVKMDNLVQVAHNVVIGEHSIVVAQVGIAGSSRLGRHVVLAGQVGVADHVEIGDGARVGAKSGVPHSVKAGEDMLGLPAVPVREWMRTYAGLQRLPRMKQEIEELKKRLHKLEESMHGD
jgi:UDP-3-O-[3-hydroxymyristoyl] glucosamine N-acyltransferase